VECSDLHYIDVSHIPPGWWTDNATTDELCSSCSICKGSVMAVTEEFGYSKVFALFMPWMLTDAHIETTKAIVTVSNMTPEVRVSGLWLSRGVETWVHHFEPDSKQHLMEHCHTKSSLRINSWVCHQLENCGYSLFGWERPGGTAVNTNHYIETLRSHFCWVCLFSKCLKCCASPWHWKDTDIWVHKRSSLCMDSVSSPTKWSWPCTFRLSNVWSS